MPTSFDDIRALMADLPQPDTGALKAAETRDAVLTKPPGALGKLETIARWLAGWQGHPPRADKPAILVFAGNHGVTAQGISAFPADVTHQMVANFESGGAAINQLARRAGASLSVTALDLDRPTGDFTQGPAMDEAATVDAFVTGMAAIGEADIVIPGDMGIGNTTVSAALAAALLGGSGADWAGPGTGLDAAGVSHKAAVIDRALAFHGDTLKDPLIALASVGGREQAAIAGAILAARLNRVPVILDGYVATASAAVLKQLRDDALDHCLLGHLSAEHGHGPLAEKLGLDPVLDLGMRLGEGSGAAVALLTVQAAADCHNGMATFAEAGVSGKSD
ncbi:MAG: nicotinate-nucleotide--dimethylbenzimidazole phosphoribosyltransferase [Pseudomonadota bacterium]